MLTTIALRCNNPNCVSIIIDPRTASTSNGYTGTSSRQRRLAQTESIVFFWVIRTVSRMPPPLSRERAWIVAGCNLLSRGNLRVLLSDQSSFLLVRCLGLHRESSRASFVEKATILLPMMFCYNNYGIPTNRFPGSPAPVTGDLYHHRPRHGGDKSKGSS